VASAGQCSAQLNTDTTKGMVSWTYTRPGTLLLEKGHFKNGLRVGYWEYFDALGRLVLREKYRKGVKRFAIIFNPSNGKITATIDRKGIVHKKPDCGCN
jgi:antitoxin component YwqK of YwqJK toxin-antitoxin module